VTTSIPNTDYSSIWFTLQPSQISSGTSKCLGEQSTISQLNHRTAKFWLASANIWSLLWALTVFIFIRASHSLGICHRIIFRGICCYKILSLQSLCQIGEWEFWFLILLIIQIRACWKSVLSFCLTFFNPRLNGRTDNPLGKFEQKFLQTVLFFSKKQKTIFFLSPLSWQQSIAEHLLNRS
jgi:hypothetical protein